MARFLINSLCKDVDDSYSNKQTKRFVENPLEIMLIKPNSFYFQKFIKKK